MNNGASHYQNIHPQYMCTCAMTTFPPPYLDINFSYVKTSEEIVEIVLLVEKCICKHIHPDMHLGHPPLDGSYEAGIPCRAFQQAKERQKMSSTCAGWWVHQLFPSCEPSLVFLNLRLAFSSTPLFQHHANEHQYSLHRISASLLPPQP